MHELPAIFKMKLCTPKPEHIFHSNHMKFYYIRNLKRKRGKTYSIVYTLCTLKNNKKEFNQLVNLL